MAPFEFYLNHRKKYPSVQFLVAMRRKVFVRFPKERKLFVKYGYKDTFRKDKFNLQNAGICEIYFENSCYERDMRDELLGHSANTTPAYNPHIP